MRMWGGVNAGRPPAGRAPVGGHKRCCGWAPLPRKRADFERLMPRRLRQLGVEECGDHVDLRGVGRRHARKPGGEVAPRARLALRLGLRLLLLDLLLRARTRLAHLIGAIGGGGGGNGSDGGVA